MTKPIIKVIAVQTIAMQDRYSNKLIINKLTIKYAFGAEDNSVLSCNYNLMSCETVINISCYG